MRSSKIRQFDTVFRINKKIFGLYVSVTDSSSVQETEEKKSVTKRKKPILQTCNIGKQSESFGKGSKRVRASYLCKKQTDSAICLNKNFACEDSIGLFFTI